MLIQNITKKQYFIFDAFGTLFQTSSVDEELKKIAGNRYDSLIQTWRMKQLEYSWLRNQMGAYVPFDQVTKEALDFSMRKHGLNHPKLFDLMLIYQQPSLVEGVFETLEYLKQKGKTICILSNGTRKMLENGVIKTEIEGMVDKLFTVDDIQIYKPSKAVYQMALNQLGVVEKDVLFFSSNQWDVAGASRFGWGAIWVNRNNEIKESLPFGNVSEISQLKELITYL